MILRREINNLLVKHYNKIEVFIIKEIERLSGLRNLISDSKRSELEVKIGQYNDLIKVVKECELDIRQIFDFINPIAKRESRQIIKRYLEHKGLEYNKEEVEQFLNNIK